MTFSKTATAESRMPLDIGQLKIHGWLGERIDRGIVAVDNLFGSLWWHGSMWGYEHVARWLRNEILYGRYCGRFHPGIDGVINTMLGLVSDGRALAKYSENALATYNEEEFLMGLLSHYEQYKDPKVLDAAKTMGQSITKNHKALAGNHYYKSLAIGRLLDLAHSSGNESFKTAALEIAEDQQLAMLKVDGQGDGKDYGGTHGAAACMIVCFHTDLFTATGDTRYLDWAKQSHQAIQERTFITGGLGEHLRFLKSPDCGQDLHDETCQHAWWLIANLRLWQATGETQYLDVAERIIYNHLIFSQLHRGEDAGFCALGNIDQGFRGQHNYICCDNEGFFSLLETARHIVTVAASCDEASINLLIPAEATISFKTGKTVTLRVETDYPVTGRVSVRVISAQPTAFALRIRVPGAQKPASFEVNGQAAKPEFAAGYAVLNRTWNDGDTLNLVFPMAMRVETDNTGFGAHSTPVTVDGKETQAKRIGVFHGPVLSALFRTGHGNDLSWVWTGDYPEVPDSGGCVFENYPTSKSDYLEADGKRYDTGRPADATKVVTAGRAPVIRWSHRLSDRVKLSQEVTIHPGLPVTMDWTETIEGLAHGDKLLCGGVRFGVAKRNKSTYGDCGFPYPFPAVTTRDDLSMNVGFVAGGGSFSLSEKLEDGAELQNTGTYRMSNGYFRVICHYDKSTVARIVGRTAKEWAGIYFEPAPDTGAFTRRLVFPLEEKPLNQDLTRLEKDSVATLKLNLKQKPSGELIMDIDGPVIQNTPILIPRSCGVKSGWLLHNDKYAAFVLDYDSERLVVRVPAPGSYSVDKLA